MELFFSEVQNDDLEVYDGEFKVIFVVFYLGK